MRQIFLFSGLCAFSQWEYHIALQELGLCGSDQAFRLDKVLGF